MEHPTLGNVAAAATATAGEPSWTPVYPAARYARTCCSAPRATSAAAASRLLAPMAPMARNPSRRVRAVHAGHPARRTSAGTAERETASAASAQAAIAPHNAAAAPLDASSSSAKNCASGPAAPLRIRNKACLGSWRTRFARASVMAALARAGAARPRPCENICDNGATAPPAATSPGYPAESAHRVSAAEHLPGMSPHASSKQMGSTQPAATKWCVRPVTSLSAHTAPTTPADAAFTTGGADLSNCTVLWANLVLPSKAFAATSGFSATRHHRARAASARTAGATSSSARFAATTSSPPACTTLR
mmetsp:Transcript_5891/g.14601  ORF Transcript_5891/g.14601 Transcript_5891/m.14601 type:complete len:306 (-) Transcript_5891:1782-2699(-)